MVIEELHLKAGNNLFINVFSVIYIKNKYN